MTDKEQYEQMKKRIDELLSLIDKETKTTFNMAKINKYENEINHIRATGIYTRGELGHYK